MLISSFHALQLQLEHGAKIDLKNLAGETPFDVAKKESNQEIVDLFIKPMSCFI